MTSFRKPALALAALGALGGGVVLLLGSHESTHPRPVVGAAASPLPSFAQPVEAARYRQAVLDGDSKMPAALDEALALARQRPETNPDYVRKLEQLRAERAARLQAYQASPVPQ